MVCASGGMVDALASGASVLRDVEVRVFSCVPKEKDGSLHPSFSFGRGVMYSVYYKYRSIHRHGKAIDDVIRR